jgi:2-polyprenyl-3-methyl-5-hydroxy-6-metoxy-1,4-benzoquinol methylase
MRPKQADEVSWLQTNTSVSLELIGSAGITSAEPLIDVGGGASVLVDRLAERGFADLTVLDLAETALAVARERLGATAVSTGSPLTCWHGHRLAAIGSGMTGRCSTS